MDKTIIDNRLSLVKEILQRNDLSYALLFNGSVGNYNTWILGEDEFPASPPFNRNDSYLISADGTVTGFSAIRPHPTEHAHDRGAYPMVDQIDFSDAFASGRIGIVNGLYLKNSVRDYFKSLCPELEFVRMDDEFAWAKAQKCPAETEGVQAAAKIYDRVFGTLPLFVRDGKLESEVVMEIHEKMTKFGADCEDLANCTIVRLTSAPSDGPSEPEPVLYPGRRLKLNDRVNILVNGYLPGGFSGALGRCYVLGKATSASKRMWGFVTEAQDLAASMAVPGMTIARIMDVLDEKILKPNDLKIGYADWIYGIGCSRYEPPRCIDATKDMELTDGMTLVIAPSICVPGEDPFCCMDVYEVTEKGGERLTQMPRDIIELF